MSNKHNGDDFCDILTKKICDNCGKCLELEGVDTKAIRIEDIAKKVEENEIIEAELVDETSPLNNNSIDSSAFEKFEFPEDEDEGYEDAFDHIEYIEDIDLSDDLTLEELTEEVYPGVRKLKGRK